MARAHVGKRMRELCQKLEPGIMDTEDLALALPHVASSVICRTLQSLRALGLVERVGGTGHKSHPYRYRVKPNWLALVESRPDRNNDAAFTAWMQRLKADAAGNLQSFN